MVNLPMLAEDQRRLHIGPGDVQAVASEGRLAMNVFSQAIAEATSQSAWCDVIYKLYGPDGSMIPGMMRR